MRLIIGFKVSLRFGLFFLPSTVGLSLEFVAMNNLTKNLELKTTTVTCEITTVCVYSFIYDQTSYIFLLKGSFGFDFIIPIFSCCEKNLLRILQQLLLAKHKLY